jgi:hypothetical protein
MCCISSIAGCLFTLTLVETGKNAVEASMAMLDEVVGAVLTLALQLHYYTGNVLKTQ